MLQEKKRFNLVTFLTNHLRLQKPYIVPGAHGTKTHVEIGKSNPEQTEPSPQHMAAIEAAHARIRAVAGFRPR